MGPVDCGEDVWMRIFETVELKVCNFASVSKLKCHLFT